MKFAVLPVAVLALLAVATVHPAMAQVDSREGIALQNQISELRHQLDDLRDNAGSRSGGGGSFLGGSRRSSSSDDSNAGNGALTPELLERINRLEDSVRQINGRLDELANTQARSQADLAKQISDLQFRLDNGGAGSAGGSTMSPGPAPLGVVSARPPIPPAAAPIAPAAAPRSPDQLLQEGSAALARRDYASAEGNARQVLAGGKSAPRGYDAQFLLAQSLAGERKPVDAALAYGDLYQRNKQGQHAQDALVGLASSQMTLGDNRSACVALDSLKAQFPTPRPDIAQHAASLRANAGCR